MESLDPTAFFMGDLLDFASDIEEDDDDHYNEQHKNKPTKRFGSLNPIVSSFDVFNDPVHDSTYPCLHEFPEEELEWLSNKDAFPSVETFVGIHENPLSVLENGTTSSKRKRGHTSTNDCVIMNYCWSLRVPVKARSKQHRRRRHDLGVHRCWWSQESLTKVKIRSSSIGRRCQHCGSEKTPQWRGGPLGPKTLCNACGVRFKSGRLVPEYRPAGSPTFCTTLHSNSHRKVLEMRRQKQMMGIMAVKPMESG